MVCNRNHACYLCGKTAYLNCISNNYLCAILLFIHHGPIEEVQEAAQYRCTSSCRNEAWFLSNLPQLFYHCVTFQNNKYFIPTMTLPVCWNKTTFSKSVTDHALRILKYCYTQFLKIHEDPCQLYIHTLNAPPTHTHIHTQSFYYQFWGYFYALTVLLIFNYSIFRKLAGKGSRHLLLWLCYAW